MDSVSEIKQKLNIVDIIGAYVSLKKTGRNYKGLCPFHKEKSPSFIVSEDIQHYRCFGCAKSGDMFKFLMDYEGLEFREALNILAEKAGVEVQQVNTANSKAQKDETERLLKMNDITENLYSNLLTKHPLGKNALVYLKKRGTSAEIIKEFGLGYAPNSWDSLSKALSKEGFSSEELDKSGLARFRKNNQDTYDLFRARLMFPLKDHLGRIVGFAGRALLKDQTPKYVNSPETLLYHKEKFLYGLYYARKHISEADAVIIVEGYSDMMSLYQHGYKNVVASSGTALTPAQVNLLKRYTSNLYFLFDTDEAGIKASIRAADVAIPLGVNLFVISIGKDVKDPDELMQKSPSSFRECIDNAITIWDYFIKYSVENFNFDNVYEKSAAYQFILAKFSNISDPVVKSTYVKTATELFEVSEKQVLADLDKVDKDGSLNSEMAPKWQDPTVLPVENKLFNKSFTKIEFHILFLLLHAKDDHLAYMIGQILEEYFENEPAKEIFKVLKDLYEKNPKSIDIKAFYDKLPAYDKNIAEMFERTYMADITASFATDDALLKEFETTRTRIKMSFHKKRITELSLNLKKFETSNEHDKLIECQHMINEQKEAIRLLEGNNN